MKPSRKPLCLAALALAAILGCDSNPTAPSAPTVPAGNTVTQAGTATAPKTKGKGAVTAPPVEQP